MIVIVLYNLDKAAFFGCMYLSQALSVIG